MHAELTGSATDRRAQVIAWLAAIGVGLFLVAPRASPATLALLVFAALMAADNLARLLLPTSIPAPIAGLLALAVWSAVSIGWAVDQRAIDKTALLIVFTLATLAAMRALSGAPPERIWQLCRAALIAYVVCLLYLLTEQATNHAVKRALFTTVPFIRPAAKHMSMEASGVVLSDYISNRNMAALTLTLWPMLLIVRRQAAQAHTLLVGIAVIALVSTSVLMSAHETSIVAIAFSALLFGTAWKLPRLALGVMTACWLAATLLVVPMASWAFNNAELHKAEWLPNSARQRIVIWAYAAGKVPDRPLTGVGIASAKTLDARRGSDVEIVPGTRYEWRSAPHNHNVYLQTWYELGAVGAAILCIFGLSLIRAISRLPGATLPYALAAFAAAFATGAFSWGMWQAWFMAAFAIAAVAWSIASTSSRIAFQKKS
jgi:O-antigen ligase